MTMTAPVAALHRYRVTDHWGDVPSAIADMADRDGAFMLYKHYQGPSTVHTVTRDREIVGGVSLAYAGVRPEDGAA